MRGTAADTVMRRGAQGQAVEAGKKGGYGRRPGGRRFAPVEEVGNRCKLREVLQLMITDGGSGRKEEAK